MSSVLIFQFSLVLAGEKLNKNIKGGTKGKSQFERKDTNLSKFTTNSGQVVEVEMLSISVRKQRTIEM